MHKARAILQLGASETINLLILKFALRLHTLAIEIVILAEDPQAIQQAISYGFHVVTLSQFYPRLQHVPDEIKNWDFKSPILYEGLSLNQLLEWDFEMIKQNRSDSRAAKERLVRTVLPYISATERVLDSINPTHVFTLAWASYWQTRLLKMAAKKRNLPKFIIERGALPGALVIDEFDTMREGRFAHGRWKTFSIAPSGLDQKLLAEYLENYTKTTQNSAETQTIRSRHQIPPDARIVFFPVQDPLLLFRHPFFSRMNEIINAIIPPNNESAAKTILIVKNHPHWSKRFSAQKTNEWVESLQDNASIRVVPVDENIQTLIQIANVVVTISSNVGLEAALLGKPVIVLSETLYSNAGFTLEPKSRAEFKAVLEDTFSNPKKDLENVEAYIFFLLNHYLFLETEVFKGSNERILQRIFGTVLEKGAAIELPNQFNMLIDPGASKIIKEVQSIHVFPVARVCASLWIREVLEKNKTAQCTIFNFRPAEHFSAFKQTRLIFKESRSAWKLCLNLVRSGRAELTLILMDPDQKRKHRTIGAILKFFSFLFSKKVMMLGDF